MPNIASALKEEIARLARKELRRETESLQKTIARYRRDIAAMKRRIEFLERAQKRTGQPPPVHAASSGGEDENLRFRAAGFAGHRKRLGLSAREMGLLLGASALSVYKWEAGQARPRAKQLQAIESVRKLGKREALKRLEGMAAA